MSSLVDLVPALAIFGVFFVLVVLPQMREKREHESFVASLAKGDRVITASGLHGVVASVAAGTVELEIATGTRITIEKDTVARRQAAEAAASA